MHSRIHLLPKVKFTSPILSQYLLIPPSLENRPSKQQLMENQSSRKHITYRITLSRHIPDINDLRRHKTRCPTSHKQIFLLMCSSSQPKITNNQLTTLLFPEHNILGFQITMDYILFG